MNKNKLDKIKKEIKNISDIKDVKIEIILDSYEIDLNCYNFIKSRDESWFKLFYTVLEIYLKDYVNIDDAVSEIKTYDTCNLYQSFIKFICEELKNNHSTIVEKIHDGTDNEIDNGIDNGIDNEIDNEINNGADNIEIEQEEIIKFEGLRKNQKTARDNNIKNNFTSGIHNQITGSGKSIIILMTMSDHYEKDITKNKGRIYILTCPRIEVLRNMFFEKNSNDEYVINKKNIQFWRDNKIINLENWKIIDKINNKDKKIEIDKNKPNILITNTDFLKILDKLNLVQYEKVNLVLFDECHGVSAKVFYSLLEKIKFVHLIHIIGFSATPLRNNAEEKVKHIFSSSLVKIPDPKLNIISNYDLMNAICDEIILPPSYTIVEINKTCNKKIGKSNKDIAEKTIKNKLKILPYKKIICWCRTIDKLKEWYEFFLSRFPELKLYCSTSKDNENKELNTDFDKFCKAENNSLLLCVNRCREGSDIKNLDCGIYLDNVKKRSTLVSIQTVGRILRPDKDKLKANGYMIDTFINDGKIEIELLTAQKVLTYYEKILSLTEGENYKGLIDTYLKMKEICDNTEYDDKTKKIKIKIDGNPVHNTEIKLELTTKIFDWTNFKNKLENIIDENFSISKEQKFKLIIDKLKKTNKFDAEKDFWKTYNKLDHDKLHIPSKKCLYGEFKDIFDSISWFEFMNFDIGKYYKTIKQCRKAICNLFDKFDGDIITLQIYNNLRMYDKKLPPFPQEYFKKDKFTSVEKEFKNDFDEYFETYFM